MLSDRLKRQLAADGVHLNKVEDVSTKIVNLICESNMTVQEGLVSINFASAKLEESLKLPSTTLAKDLISKND